MIEQLPSNADKILAFTLSGKLHDADYRTFVAAIDTAVTQHDKVRLLAQFHDFHGWDANALWDDIKFSVNHCTKFDRIALVGDKTWEQWMAKVCQPFTMADVQYFDTAKIDDAWKWLREGLSPSVHPVDEPAESASPKPPLSGRRTIWRRAVLGLGLMLAVYFLVAYVLMPAFWNRYTHRHPAVDEMPGITETSDGHPGDPLNVALIGSEDNLREIMRVAGWYPAAALGLRSDLRIAGDTVLKRSYDEAPVSSLYLFGRKEDLAFEQPVGDDPRQRHHVRFWKSAKVDDQGRPLWAGSATYDRRVGLSHTTGQITHHIAADVDAERDHLFDDLARTGDLTDEHFIDDFHKVREERNGGGDPWHTDGRLLVGTIQIAASP